MIEFYLDKYGTYIFAIKNKYYLYFNNDVIFNTQLHSTDKRVRHITKEFSPSHIQTIYDILYRK